MPAPTRLAMTLADIMTQLKTDPSLPPSTRIELQSRIRRFCEIAGKHPAEVIAEPVAIRLLVDRASWQMAAISKSTWANITSAVTRGMDHVGVSVHRRRRNFALSATWDAVLASLTRRDHDEIHRFAGWCAVRKIEPSQVDIERFDEFRDYLETATIQRNPRERWHVARRAWNRTIASRPDSAFPTIPNCASQAWRARPWSAFPISLQNEVTEYRKQMLVGDPTAEDGIKPIKSITIENYLANLRWHMSRLVDAGIPIETFSSLAICIEIPHLNRGIKELLAGRKFDKKIHSGPHALVVAALSASRYLGEPEAKRIDLKKILKRIRHQPKGMTKKNRERLSQFSESNVTRALLRLPFKIFDELAGIPNPKVRHAQRMQLACLLAILLFVPIRIRNAAELDLNTNIQRPLGGKAGKWRLSFEHYATKNDEAIDAELNIRVSELLDCYVCRFRSVISAIPSGRLFLGQRGKPKCPGQLSKQFSAFLKRELGLTVNAHLMRHLAGFIWLNAHPGKYEAARQLLGHKNIETTIRFYSGAEKTKAYEQYDQMLTKMMDDGVAVYNQEEYDL